VVGGRGVVTGADPWSAWPEFNLEIVSLRPGGAGTDCPKPTGLLWIGRETWTSGDFLVGVSEPGRTNGGG
jgi:hypothetical protein